MDYIVLSLNFVNSCTMMWSSAYHFEVKVYQIVADVPLKFSVNVLFLANSCSLRSIKLKLDLYLDHDVEQHILF